MQQIDKERMADGSQPTVREIDLDDAVVLAIECQRSGRLDDAEALFRKILEVAPDHADALHFSGVLAHQQGKLEEATVRLKQSLALRADQPDWYANLAVNLQARDMLEEAIAACEDAIHLDPDHATAYANLGALLKLAGRSAEAEDAYRTALRLNPEHTGAYTNLGILLAGQGRTREACACYCKVITLSPRHPHARRLLAMAHCTLGEVDKAREIYREWLGEEPDNPVAQHMLAACSGEEVPVRASDGFISVVFDEFASTFESRLAHLQYRAPALDVLDAGCGTGLCGVLVSPYARRLVGVDLSAGMLAQAREKRVYDELVQGELTEYLRTHRGGFDVIVCADTLVYFGSLEVVASAAARALRGEGCLIFTVEEWTDAGAADEFSICPHGRFRHAPAYVERMLTDGGLVPAFERGDLRMEGGVPVAGLLVRASRLLTGASHA